MSTPQTQSSPKPPLSPVIPIPKKTPEVPPAGVDPSEYTTIDLKDESPPVNVTSAFFGALLRGNKVKKLAPLVLTLVIDVALPVALYFILKAYIKPVWALLVAGGPALIMVILKGIIKRQFDIIGALVFFAFGLSAIIAIVTGDARILVFEKSIVTAVLGLVFLLTLIPFRCTVRRGEKKGDKFILRPFMFYILKQVAPIGEINMEKGSEVSNWEDKYAWMWREISYFRKMLITLDSLWGIGFFIEFIGRLAMALSPLSLDAVVLWSNVFFAVVLVLMIVFTFVFVGVKKNVLREDMEAWLTKNEAKLQLGELDKVTIFFKKSISV